MITIHNFSRGVRGVRVAWLCEEMGLAYRMEAVNYPPSPAYLELYALGSVPFLVDDLDGAGAPVKISESLAMLLYIAGRYGPTSLLPGPDRPQALGQTLRFTLFAETELNPNPLIAARFAAPEADKRNWTVRGLDGRFERCVTLLEAQLALGPYLAGADFTLADIAVSTALGMWRGILGKTLPPRLSDLLDRVQARPAYAPAREACL
jgi:glutathione S-transferase